VSKRFRVTWGDPPGMGDHPDEWHCVACGTPLPRVAAVQCRECAHAWRWGWLLSLHDFRLHLRLSGWRPVRLPRIPSRVWICPCCAHDL